MVEPDLVYDDDDDDFMAGNALEIFVGEKEYIQEFSHPFPVIDVLVKNVLYLDGLTIIALWKCIIPVRAAVLLGEAIKQNTTICKLSCNFNALTNVEAIHIFAALRHNQTLKLLDLSFNRLGPDAKELAAELETNQTLQFLLLQRNKLKGGITDFLTASALSEVAAFDFAFNITCPHYDSHSLCTLMANHIKTNPTNLRYLQADFNYFSAESRAELILALQQNTQLLEFCLDHFDDEDDDDDAAANDMLNTYLTRNQQVYMDEWWHQSNHYKFPQSCKQVIMTTLLCQTHNTVVPIYIYWQIFAFFLRKDFM